LPNLKEIITNDNLEEIGNQLIILGKLAGNESGILYIYILYQLKRSFTPDFVITNWDSIVKIGIASGHDVIMLFRTLFRLGSILGAIFVKENWHSFVHLSSIAESNPKQIIGRDSSSNVLLFFNNCLLKLIETFNEGFVRQNWDMFYELGKFADTDMLNFFTNILPYFKDKIKDKDSLQKVGNSLIIIRKLFGQEIDVTKLSSVLIVPSE